MKLAGIVALAFLALICKFETAQCNLHIFSSRTVLQKRWLSRAASQIWDFYLPTRVDPNSTCGLALQNMAVSLADKSSIWAARMVDSWGKSDDGIIYGRFYYEGSYDECMSVASPEQGIRGKYCRITMRKEKNSSGLRSPKLLPPWFAHRPEVRIVPSVVEDLEEEEYFRYSTCVPSICSHQDLWESLNVTYSEYKSTIVDLSCKEMDPSAALNSGDYAYM
ncbi:uncharacterized protein LOC134769393 [Penaeus indicus]|uniref:uncharacterized protein LOC134769393 n=1 Tax=Penaeus indicus TaxID=29960 RepID=UPI00300D781D